MSADWQLIETLLRQTLTSLARQTCQDLQVLIVCHDTPDLARWRCAWTMRSLVVMEAPFAPPRDRIASQMRQDKENKITIGATKLLQHGCDWIMKLDADDLIARETCAFIDNSASDAVIFRKGISRVHGSKWHIVETKNFHRICGSCFAFRRHLLAQNNGVTPPAFRFFGSDHHEDVIEKCSEYSATVSYPPFAAACYVNYTDVRLSALYHPFYRPTLRSLVGHFRRLRFTTRAAREQFAIGYS